MSAIYFEKDDTVKKEIEEFSGKIEAFKNGSLDGDEFKHRRLMQGIYGQRQPEKFMVRIKIPAGHLTSEMVEGLSETADAFADGNVHITTRQDVQLYYVNLDSLIPLLDKIADFGITTREASGATLRNVITSAYAGSLREQNFNILPFVETVVRYFLRHPETQHLPRKFKVSFSENEDDLGVTSINDMGLIARIVDGKPGFKIMLGGSLGSTPIFSRVYKEFIPAKDLLLEMLSILRAFDRHGNRAKRAEARLKFQFEKMGYDKFIELAEKEKAGILEEKVEFPEIVVDIPPVADFDFSNPFDKSIQLDRHVWFNSNVKATIRKDEYMVIVQVPNGDIKTDVFLALSKAHKEWNDAGATEFITLVDNQNLILKGLVTTPEKKKEFFGNVFKTLKLLGLGKPGFHNIADAITCLGSATCASGITHSPGLATTLSEKMRNTWFEDERFQGSTIHISGCSNACARHQVATLGFSGRADKTFEDGKEAPAYNLFYGGDLLPDGKARLGRKVSEKLLAKRIPSFIEALVNYFKEKAGPETSFINFIAEIDENEMNNLVSKFSVKATPVESDEMLHYDWGKDKPYVMEYGEGECS
ncbi:MAG: nitrite/sulfite reductase [Leptospirales bacterium]